MIDDLKFTPKDFEVCNLTKQGREYVAARANAVLPQKLGRIIKVQATVDEDGNRVWDEIELEHPVLEGWIVCIKRIVER